MARKRLARWFAAANARRGELIGREFGGGPPLTGAERRELEVLQRKCGDEIRRVFPLPGSGETAAGGAS